MNVGTECLDVKHQGDTSEEEKNTVLNALTKQGRDLITGSGTHVWFLNPMATTQQWQRDTGGD
uniref:Uncharacterized protein n=1 Tax=Anguilla anguilla TaxID=7936 RepID=A0A0E9QEF0_ANGAN